MKPIPNKTKFFVLFCLLLSHHVHGKLGRRIQETRRTQKKCMSIGGIWIDCADEADDTPSGNSIGGTLGGNAVPGQAEPPTPSPTLPPEGTLAEVFDDQYYDEDLFPLGHCHGDCDEDYDCKDDHVCFQRNFNEPVPGCLGEGEETRDYCVHIDDLPDEFPPRPANEEIPLVVVADIGYNDYEEGDMFPLGRCQADCDLDRDCELGLICGVRWGHEKIPGCSGQGVWGYDYCFDAADWTGEADDGEQLILASVGWDGVPNTAFPLQQCEGDCDQDTDCVAPLRCFNRLGFEPVPGCAGGGAMDDDYCYDPDDAPLIPAPNEPFRLKMFWDNYFIQEELLDRRWCMDCYNCTANDELWITNCGITGGIFEFVPPNQNNAQIRVYRTDYCLTQRGYKVRLEACNNENKQKWIAREGNFGGNNFDIRPVGGDKRCMSQHHHPKADELIYLEKCELAHAHDTALWTRY